MKTLRDWLPKEAIGGEYAEDRIQDMLDDEVVEEVERNLFNDKKSNWRAWPGRHVNVHNWCVLANGKAVGFNENPSTGWSFPVIKAPR